MSEKDNAKFSLGILLVILLTFILADFFTSDQIFSEDEMRLLTVKPEFHVEDILAGTFEEQYSEAVEDQLPGREKLIKMQRGFSRLFGQKEENGVYLGKDGYLFAVHLPDSFTEEEINDRISRLDEFVKKWDAQVMLVPTADYFLSDKMPFSAPYFDESKLLLQVEQTIGEENYIDVYAALLQHSEEELYYKTDSHWTSIGAYYGFLAWAKHNHKSVFSYDIENMTTVSINFQGDLQKKVKLQETSDDLKVFTETLNAKVEVNYDNGVTNRSFYSDSYLSGDNPYGYFLDGGHGITKIRTGCTNRKTLLFIKGSYGNSFLPLLMHNYTDIYVLDMEYENREGEIAELLENFEKNNRTDVLVLYDCIEFLEYFSF